MPLSLRFDDFFAQRLILQLIQNKKLHLLFRQALKKSNSLPKEFLGVHLSVSLISQNSYIASGIVFLTKFPDSLLLEELSAVSIIDSSGLSWTVKQNPVKPASFKPGHCQVAFISAQQFVNSDCAYLESLKSIPGTFDEKTNLRSYLFETSQLLTSFNRPKSYETNADYDLKQFFG